MDDQQREEEAARPRPKVTDKRISSGGAPSPRYAPAPSRDPAPEPPAAAATPAAPAGPDSAEVAPAATAPAGDERAPASRATGEQAWTPEQEAEARRIADEIVTTPSLDWVVNVAATLANVAGTKLEMGAAPDAQLAIDALAALTKELGPRLQGAEDPLRRTLAQLQLAYAQRVSSPGAEDPAQA